MLVGDANCLCCLRERGSGGGENKAGRVFWEYEMYFDVPLCPDMKKALGYLSVPVKLGRI